MPKQTIKLNPDTVYRRIVKMEDDSYDEKEGILKATLTTWGNEDWYGDVMAQGAFDEWIGENDACPTLWSHRSEDPIGMWGEFKSDSKGLHAVSQLVKGVQRADEFIRLYEADIVKGVSVGFRLRGKNPYEVIYDEEQGYVTGIQYTNLNLIEASLCLWPANELAEVTEVKNSDGTIDFRALERAVYKTTNLSKRESCDIFSRIRASGDPREESESGDPLTFEQRVLRALVNSDWSKKIA